MIPTCIIHLVHIGKRSTALFLLNATEEELKMWRTRRGGVSHTLKMYLAEGANNLVSWYFSNDAINTSTGLKFAQQKTFPSALTMVR